MKLFKNYRYNTIVNHLHNYIYYIVKENKQLKEDLKDACYVIEKIKKEKQQVIDYINNEGILDLNGYDLLEILNNEVEIIKEKKKIEKIEYTNHDGKYYMRVNEKQNYIIREVDTILIDEINKILDKINEVE